MAKVLRLLKLTANGRHRMKLKVLFVQFLLSLLSTGALSAASIGDPAPAVFPERWVKGSPVKIGPGTNIFVVEFWATWCGPCKRSIPHLTELQRKYADKGVIFVGFSDEKMETVQPFVTAQGGNMDYRLFAPGTTAWFPVSVPGALFYLGDGHACQGDGEITGTGIETSFEMEVTFRVLKRTIAWPRGETADDIFTVGNARPLDQALQHATTEMSRWLGEDFGLDARAASQPVGARRLKLSWPRSLHDPAFRCPSLRTDPP